MSDRIVFQGANGVVVVLTPAIPQMIAPGVLAPVQLNIMQIAEKDAPAGVPFWIVNENDLPPRELRPAWTLDGVSEPPHGTGKGALHYDFD